jgi:hypothetical protein
MNERRMLPNVEKLSVKSEPQQGQRRQRFQAIDVHIRRYHLNIIG